MERPDFRDLVADAHHGVEGRERVLHDHRDLLSAHVEPIFGAESGQVATVQNDRPVGDACA
jgi:hypothetical protein